jgi:TRAP-type C4-dicarboxylate transport system permease small subunit
LAKASNLFLNFVMGTSLIIVAVVTFAQVVSRSLLEFSIPWSTDVIRMAFVYLIFSGAAVAVRERAHISVDLLDAILPTRLALLFDAVVKVLVAGLLAFLSWLGLVFVLGAGTQRMPYLDVPISYLYFASPLFAAIMLLYQIGQLVEISRRFLSAREGEENQGAD